MLEGELRGVGALPVLDQEGLERILETEIALFEAFHHLAETTNQIVEPDLLACL